MSCYPYHVYFLTNLYKILKLEGMQNDDLVLIADTSDTPTYFFNSKTVSEIAR